MPGTSAVTNPTPTITTSITTGNRTQAAGDNDNPRPSTSSASRKRHRGEGTLLFNRNVKRSRNEFEGDSSIYASFYGELDDEELSQVQEKLNICNGDSSEEVDGFKQKYNCPDLKIGSILKSKGAFGIRSLTHFGVYIGLGRIVQFTGGTGGNIGGEVKVENLSEFVRLMEQAPGVSEGSIQVEVENPANALPATQILHNALKETGRTDYDVLSNNCEHLARGVVTGDYKSYQAEGVLNIVRTVGGVADRLAGIAQQECVRHMNDTSRDWEELSGGVSQGLQGGNQLLQIAQGSREGSAGNVFSGMANIIGGSAQSIRSLSGIANRNIERVESAIENCCVLQ